MSDEIQQLARLIDEATRVVVFTGAGISTESGIPDFRSPNGIWSQTTPIYFDEYVKSADARIEAWRARSSMRCALLTVTVLGARRLHRIPRWPLEDGALLRRAQAGGR